MLDGHVPSRLLVGVGPGSFTGLRVGIAASHGLAIGWSIPLSGMNSLALLAASAPPGDGLIAAAVSGGHGELFVQSFDRRTLIPTGGIASLPPAEAARTVSAPLIVGSGAQALVDARGTGEALHLLPSASRAMRLPDLLRAMDCKPVYIRAPDARPKAA
jgi:tRNA threonylcarbamoyl adenosine modification protein YeaZ